MESDDLRHLMVKDGAKIRIFQVKNKFLNKNFHFYGKRKS